jgi:hypothetical protein
MGFFRRWARVGALLAVGNGAVLACGGGDGARSTFDGGQSQEIADTGATQLGDATLASFGDGASASQEGAAPTDANGPLVVSPAGMQTLTVTIGQPLPTLAFHATIDGLPVIAAWSVDRGEVGSVVDGVFTPTGDVGGVVTITVSHEASTVEVQILVKLLVPAQNGGTPQEIAQDAGGSGGVGGVGGAGVGPGVTDPAVSAALTAAMGGAPDGGAKALSVSYPYDATVWPRGLNAPLIQWDASLGSASGIALHLETTTGSFVYDGMFGPPALLGSAPFVNHPIPQDIWAMATNTAQDADKLTMRIAVVVGGVAYGPATQTWTIAPARLTGTVYYNSYLTHLLTNSEFNVNGVYVGAGVIGIRAGASDPFVVAGTTDPDGGTHGAGCRACHSVAALGSRLIVQHGPPSSYPVTSSYDLLNGYAEMVLTSYPSTFAWAALSPDGTMAVTNAVSMAANDSTTHVYSFLPDGGPIAMTGLDGVQAGTPTFSPDGKHVAFTLHSGTVGSIHSQDTQVVVMDVDGTTFDNPRSVFTIPAGDAGTGATCVGFPAFTPASDALLIQYQLAPCGSARFNPYLGTGGVRSEIWYTDLAGAHQVPLATLNGKNADGTLYVPTGPNNHADDSTLNYEPTVNPVPSGGYAWVVFTSRRLYGNIATIDPYWSDPRISSSYDYNTQPTTKKLWVAAIDLNAPPGTDPSHPAFYLPAQELLAGNSRGYWVLDPCQSNGASCTSGDMCCGGFCQPVGDGGALVCANQSTTTHCSMVQERCASALDCCETSNACVNGFCSTPTPPR